MRLKPAEKENESSFSPSVEKIQSHPPNSTKAGNGPARANEKSGAVVYLKNGFPEMFQFEEMKEEFSEEVQESESHPIESFLARVEAEASESREKGHDGTAFMSSFLVELVHTIKNSLASVYNSAVLSLGRDADAANKSDAHVKIKEDIKRIDSVLNSLMNFININTPITKSDTLSVIFEDVLEANSKQLQEKNIRIVKRCEKNLPETYFHAEQVRFVLHSILQYAVFLTRAHDTVWVLMRSSDNHGGLASREAPENKGYVEVMIGFNGGGRLGSATEHVKETSQDQRETTDLILALAREILQKNHGVMAVKTGEIEPKTLITARFPVERRKVVYYAPIAL